jgi:CopG family nickel-responsive transcriptional regulator
MKRKEKTIRFSVSLSEALLAELDARVVKKGYASRSELIRDLIREKMSRDTWTGGREEAIAVLSITYDHHRRELVERLLRAQHSRYVHILCSMHVHLDHDHCLESIVIRGKPREIEKISIEISGLKGVVSAGLKPVPRLPAG